MGPAGVSPVARRVCMWWFGLVREVCKKFSAEGLGVRSARWPGANGLKKCGDSISRRETAGRGPVVGEDHVCLREKKVSCAGAERTWGSGPCGGSALHRRFCLFPKKNGEPLKSFKQRGNLIIGVFIGIKDHFVSFWQMALRGKQIQMQRDQLEGDCYCPGQRSGMPRPELILRRIQMFLACNQCYVFIIGRLSSVWIREIAVYPKNESIFCHNKSFSWKDKSHVIIHMTIII